MIAYSRPKRFDLYTLCQSKLLENHSLHSGTYLYGPYMAVPPPGTDLTAQSHLLSFIGEIVYAPAELFVERSISNYTPLSVMVCQVHVLKEAGIPFLHKKDTKQNKTAQSAEDLFYYSTFNRDRLENIFAKCEVKALSYKTVSSTGSKAKSA